MIRVKIDLVPYGIKSLKEELGWIEIWNDNGKYRYHGECTDMSGKLRAIEGTVDHDREDDVFTLLKSVFSD